MPVPDSNSVLPELTLFPSRLLPETQELVPESRLSERLEALHRSGPREPGRGSLEKIGQSEEGRTIWGARLGRGPRRISLVSGAHSDEPIGAITLTALIEDALTLEEPPAWLEGLTVSIIPHLNPDGAAINEAWMREWPDPRPCLREVFRELPGRDVEFGYPDLRAENRVATEFLESGGPYELHASLHGMLVSDGGLLLIERGWVERTARLREIYGDVMRRELRRLHDHDRGGEKGFETIGPGFTTTPRGTAMREHFESIGDPSTAALFRQSSMEWVQSLGGDPLCLVTEIPLFLLENEVAPPEPGRPVTYLEFRQALPRLRSALERGESVAAELERFGVTAVPVARAVALQLLALQLGLSILSDPPTPGA